MPFALKFLLLFVVGAVAGVINSVAAGGTLLTFPALMFTGVPAIVANATNTVAVQFGTFASLWSYRREFATRQKWAWRFGPPSVLGGLLGGVLLLHTGENYFRAVVPFLILFATLLFTFQPAIARWLQLETEVLQKSRHALWAAIFFQFLVGIYGGYFGAGMGFIMLAVMRVLVPADVHQINSLKVLLGSLINAIAGIYFIASGKVLWMDVLLVSVGTVLGGYYGPILARKVGAGPLRVFVSVVGFTTAIYFFFRR